MGATLHGGLVSTGNTECSMLIWVLGCCQRMEKAWIVADEERCVVCCSHTCWASVWILRLLLKWETSLLGLVAVKSLSLYFVNGFMSLSQGTCSECCQCFLDVLEKKHTFFLDTSMSWIVLRKMPSYLVEPVLSVLRNTSRLLEDFQGTSIDAWISLGLGNFASICPVLGG